jgi:hypothetical protein
VKGGGEGGGVEKKGWRVGKRVEGGGWRVEDGGWRVEGGGRRVEGWASGWRWRVEVEGGGRPKVEEGVRLHTTSSKNQAMEALFQQFCSS